MDDQHIEDGERLDAHHRLYLVQSPRRKRLGLWHRLTIWWTRRTERRA